jgi:NTE family protein
MRRGLVLGCGGTLGAAWTVGALTAVEEALGWDVREAEVIIGTSAGAEFVTMLGSGVSVAELLDVQRGRPDARADLVAHLESAPARFPPLPRPRLGSPRLSLRGGVPGMTKLAGLLPVGTGDPAWLAGLADMLVPDGGWVPHPNARIVAVDYDTGERVAFGAPDAPKLPLREAVCASWAIPGWFPPIRSGGRRFVDGGVASPASADLVLSFELDEVLVLAPMASAVPGRPQGFRRVEQLLRTPMTKTLDAEIALLRDAGVKVLRLDPGPADLAAMGPNLMDGRRRLGTLETSLRTSRAALTP